jgi:hypothetical protein
MLVSIQTQIQEYALHARPTVLLVQVLAHALHVLQVQAYQEMSALSLLMHAQQVNTVTMTFV